VLVNSKISTFYAGKKGIGIRIHPKPVAKFKDKVREVLLRSNDWNTKERITAINCTNMGWINYFGIADMKKLAGELDE
jgi:RNA-directed DNA polymerase